MRQSWGDAGFRVDSNVIWELMHPQPEPRVLAWANGLNPEAVAITAMNDAEILHGLTRLADGRRKQQLRQSWDALATELFPGRIWGVSLATRNVIDFAEIGLELINPWDLP